LAADLRRLDRAKTQFLLSTQHHLRSPLSVINGYLSMIDEGSYGKINQKIKKKKSAPALKPNKKLIRLVDELLDVAHFQMNKSAAAKEPVDAVALAAQVVADLKPAAEVKNLYLKFKNRRYRFPKLC
jgi:Signal transduction histidine kinase